MSAADANNLKTKVTLLENEMSKNTLALNASENSKRTMEKKLEKMEAELKKYESQQVGCLPIILTLVILEYFITNSVVLIRLQKMTSEIS